MEIAYTMLQLLDGNRDHAALVDELTKQVAGHHVALPAQTGMSADKQTIHAVIAVN